MGISLRQGGFKPRPDDVRAGITRSVALAAGLMRSVYRCVCRREMEIQRMKTFVTALVVAAGLSLGAGAAVAAPVSMPGSGTTLNVGSLLTPAQYYGGGGYGYRRHCYYVRRCGYGPYGYHCWRERICR
jgi:hypothetical protein